MKPTQWFNRIYCAIALPALCAVFFGGVGLLYSASDNIIISPAPGTDTVVKVNNGGTVSEVLRAKASTQRIQLAPIVASDGTSAVSAPTGLSTTTVTATGAVSAASISSTGSVSAGSVSSTGAVSGSSITVTNGVTQSGTGGNTPHACVYRTAINIAGACNVINRGCNAGEAAVGGGCQFSTDVENARGESGYPVTGAQTSSGSSCPGMATAVADGGTATGWECWNNYGGTTVKVYTLCCKQ